MVYNTRAKTFPQGQQITIYSKTFSKDIEGKNKNEKLSKAYKNEERTEKQEDNCKRISIKQTKNRIYGSRRRSC